ncbi:sensory transduction histidine kinase bacterial, putative [Ricinus communis]|uniref:Sensory transduction histidine kinase bacterial, putative n=2 Tax=Ricinus communis TaxID=3988 RepID=B9S7Q6_RICCO|nr:sensory transduction histidine kinase bacterial, putative [Ricinus communis]|eukprot:XP_002522025.1 two-component response regulator 24 [Ricinus communis]
MGSEKMTMSSESSTANDEKKNSNSKPLSVLLVDDNIVLRTIHKAMLTRQGMEVHLAVNGQEAVEFHRAGASFDLILMDLDMPIMDGCQATKELRDMGINCAIIGVAACSDSERKTFMESGLDDCISVPFSLEKIACYILLLTDDNIEVGDNINNYYDYTEEEEEEEDDRKSIRSSCSSNTI